MKAFSLRVPSICWGLILSAVLIVPCTTQAQSWQATVGAQSKDMGRQAMAFLPNEMWIHTGDSITWTFDASALHTVTFLITANSGQPAQTRPPAPAGCPGPGITPDGAAFDGDECVNSGRLTSGSSYTVYFPEVGNFKLVCLVHPSMTGVVHVLPLSEPLPHDQDFYDDQAAKQRRNLLFDRDRDGNHGRGNRRSEHSHWNQVTAGVGEIVGTPGGEQTLSVVRFMEATKVIHVGEVLEWNNSDPVEPHTITFGTEPKDLMSPSANVTLDGEGSRDAVINSPTDSVHSGFIVASGHERTGVAQAALGVTRFRVKFTSADVYPYVCALHDGMGMKGKVIVLP